MRVTLRQLEYLIAVADTGSVTAAAHTLHLSQSAVWQALQDTEHILGLSIFHRGARGLSITSEGHTVLRRARRLVAEAESFEATGRTLADTLSGTLSVGCFPTIAGSLMAPLITRFADEHPGVDLHLNEGSRRELVAGLDHGDYDVIIMYGYDFPEDITITGDTLVLGAIPPYVLLPPEHRLVDAAEVQLADLIDDDFILYSLEPADRYFLSIFTEQNLTPHIRYRIKNSAVVHGLVSRGAGYSMLTQRQRPASAADGRPFVQKDIAGSPKPLDVIAAVPSCTKVTGRVEKLIDYAREYFRDNIS